MPFYRDHVYPHLVSMLGTPKPIDDIRQRIVPLAQGDVLEIGVGPGVNFAHYDRAKVDRVFALEPNPGMLRRAEAQRRRSQLKVVSRSAGRTDSVGRGEHLYLMHDSGSGGGDSGHRAST